MGVLLTPGQDHESTVFEATVDRVAVPTPNGRVRRRPRRVAGDKAYSAKRIRAWLRRHGIAAVIARPKNRVLSANVQELRTPLPPVSANRPCSHRSGLPTPAPRAPICWPGGDRRG